MPRRLAPGRSLRRVSTAAGRSRTAQSDIRIDLACIWLMLPVIPR
jgi:hypothetical protein